MKTSLIVTMELPVKIVKGTLIDIETTGLNPSEDEIVTLGCVIGNKILVIQRRVMEEDAYCIELKEKVISKLPEPYYAYNSEFESSFFQEKLGIQAEWVDLMEPWRGIADRLGFRWPRLIELVRDPEIYFNLPRITGREVPTIWKAFVKTKDEELLRLIVKKNMGDLLKELYLLIVYSYFDEIQKESQDNL